MWAIRAYTRILNVSRPVIVIGADLAAAEAVGTPAIGRTGPRPFNIGNWIEVQGRGAGRAWVPALRACGASGPH